MFFLVRLVYFSLAQRVMSKERTAQTKQATTPMPMPTGTVVKGRVVIVFYYYY